MFWSVCLFVLLVFFLFFGRNKCMKFLKNVKDFIVILSLIHGQRSTDRRSADFRSKLYSFMCESDLLDEATVNELYILAKEYINTSYSIHDFHKYLLTQTYVVAFRDSTLGSLRGFMVYKIIRKKDYNILNIGTTVMSHKYRGGHFAFYTGSYLIFKEFFLHPFTTLYVIGKSFGYKSYISFRKMWPEDVYPSYKKKTPEFMLDIMENFAKSIMTDDEEYVRETGAIKRTGNTLKSFASTITDEDMKDPDIKFYCESNPGWADGNCLVTILKANLSTFFKALRKTIFSRRKRSVKTSKHKAVPPPVFGRRFSYIEKETGRYYVPSVVSDFLGGEEEKGAKVKPKNRLLIKKPTLSAFSEESDPFGSIEIDDDVISGVDTDEHTTQ